MGYVHTYKFTYINAHTLFNFLFGNNFTLQKNYKNSMKKYPGIFNPDSPALNILRQYPLSVALFLYIFFPHPF